MTRHVRSLTFKAVRSSQPSIMKLPETSRGDLVVSKTYRLLPRVPYNFCFADASLAFIPLPSTLIIIEQIYYVANTTIRKQGRICSDAPA